MDDRALEPATSTEPDSAEQAMDAEIATLTDVPAKRDRAATITWLKQRPGATLRWITNRPWLGLPLLAIFPAIAWQLDRTRPPAPETNNPAARAGSSIRKKGSGGGSTSQRCMNRINEAMS